MTVLLHKRGTGVPTADAFHSVGEILIDTSTGMAYTLTDAGTVVALTGSHYTGADAVKLTGDQTVAGHKTYSDVATFGDTVILRGLLNGDSGANFGGDVTAAKVMSASFTDMAGKSIIPDMSAYQLAGEPNIIGTKGVSTMSTYGFGGPEYFIVPVNADGAFDGTVSLGNGSFKWNVVHAKMYYKDGSPMIAAEELVDVFTTLRRAIDDEDTAEGVKTALSNALGGLIEKFEAMNDDG